MAINLALRANTSTCVVMETIMDQVSQGQTSKQSALTLHPEPATCGANHNTGCWP